MKRIVCAILMIACTVSSSWAAVFSVDDLITEFEKNQLRFDRNYMKKNISVEGYIRSIEERQVENYKFFQLTILGAIGKFDSSHYIECHFDESEENALLDLNKGDIIVVNGTYDGKQYYQTGSLFLKNCILENVETEEVVMSIKEFTSQVISELRNLKAASIMLFGDNYDKQDTIKPDIELLIPYMDNPSKFTKTQGEYLFLETGGKWWVGRNLAISVPVDKRKALSEEINRIVSRTFFAGTDENAPYNGEDTIYMRVK
ncbi:MAG: OB-fold putative lipoprotein [Synergistaceae bacterium]|nr:OB-fold putative lipoprotein [Synergistaceae bacterium]